MDLHERKILDAASALMNLACERGSLHLPNVSFEELLAAVIENRNSLPSQANPLLLASVSGIRTLLDDLPEIHRADFEKEVLKGLISKAFSSQDKDPQKQKWLAKLPTLPHENEPEEQQEARRIITQEGGIYIGRNELRKLGRIGSKQNIPNPPSKFGQKFLTSPHPFRSGSIASHIILGFDDFAGTWKAIDRGSGGRSDVIPGSLGETYFLDL